MNGVLTKIALTQMDTTFEDSSQISNKLGERLATKVVMEHEVSLGKNSNILYTVTKGQKVKSGDPLIIFDESFEDENINNVLNKLGDKYISEIEELSKNTIKTKYTGEIVKINIYYNYEIEEYSESIQKLLKKFITKNRTKNSLIEKNSTNDFNKINMPMIEKVDGNKVKNKNIDGILIQYYIEYYDLCKIGDKITFYTAIKTIIADTYEDDEIPYSDYDKSEDVDAIVSPLSIISRLTMDIFFSMYGNKALIELKKQCKKIFES